MWTFGVPWKASASPPSGSFCGPTSGLCFFHPPTWGVVVMLSTNSVLVNEELGVLSLKKEGI